MMLLLSVLTSVTPDEAEDVTPGGAVAMATSEDGVWRTVSKI